MNRPISVMYFIDSMNFGGAEILLLNLASGLKKRGYQVSVRYSTPGPLVKEFEEIDIPVVRLPRFARVDPFLLMRMWREIRQEKPDIVHTHLFKSDFHGRIAARLAGVPVVVSTLHNCDNWARNPVLSKIYGLTARFADKIIAVSQEVKDFAVDVGLSRAEYLETIPNAVPFEQFRKDNILRQKIRSEMNISENSPVLGIVARLSEQKDHSNFIHAANLIYREVPEARFLIVGEGPLRKPLEDLVNSLDLEHVIIFSGARRDIRAIYSALDILVFSSRWEGLPVALLEGMAAELPIVATAVGGIPETLKDQTMGYLVPPADAMALANACLRLVKNPEKRQKMGAVAYEHVKSNYCVDAMVNATFELYQTLLQGV
jgi:glycosyltransferase involved in cell wall biosynthesis